MNVSSHYKNHINSDSNKKHTIHIKNIDKHTPIPTAIKLRTPEPIQSEDECSIFDYPLHDIVNTDFANISTYSKLAICPYFVTTCKIDTVYISHIYNIFCINIHRLIKSLEIY